MPLRDKRATWLVHATYIVKTVWRDDAARLAGMAALMLEASFSRRGCNP